MPPHSNERDAPASPGRAGEIPEPLRAVAGLAATMLDQARHLPTAITGLPVRVAGIAMQTSLRLQQRYASLVVKGDELLTQISRSEDTDPPWATFDDDIVEVADSVTENVGVDVTTADDSSTPSTSEVALPPSPGPTRSRSRRNASSTARMGHAPSAFDLTEDLRTTGATQGTTDDGGMAAAEIGSNGHATTAEQAPVPGYDAFTLAQLRARLRTFDGATLHNLLNYERDQRARTPYLAMLENRLNRSREQG
ncbi:MAG: lipid droplet-associated protein [Geodermatophilaceae bacterium]|nr:lipid droplet-associated protein [Geodermatophilaceae bacterium]